MEIIVLLPFTKKLDVLIYYYILILFILLKFIYLSGFKTHAVNRRKKHLNVLKRGQKTHVIYNRLY